MTSTASPGSADDVRNRGQQAILASQRAKQEKATRPAEENRTGRFTGYFPLGYKEGFNQWWSSVSPATAEHNVLSYIPYLKKPPTHMQTGYATVSTNASAMSLDADPAKAAAPVKTNTNTDPYGPRSWRSAMVQLSGKNRALNEFSVERDGEEVEENLVMLHGYGAGLGFFYKNFEGLSRVPGWKLYALDLLGMGRSTRPPFKVRAKDPEGKINEAENWFIDALEEWRIIKKIDKFTLLGHSMGGYMAVAYALKYPGHLNKLILASPVGIPEDPYAVAAEMPDEPEESALANEFLQDQEVDIVNKKAGDNNNFLNARSKAAPSSKGTDTPPRRPIPKWVSYLWDANISPFSIVRWTGPLGPRFVSGWTSRRFSHLPEDEAQALHEYSYSLFRQRGSGEYALAYILAPGAFARSPLIRRIQGVGRQMMPAPEGSPVKQVRERGYPIVLMYGENDWMDIAGGFAAEEKIKEAKALAMKGLTEEEKRKDNGKAKVVVIRKAGHHVYLDGDAQFNEVMREEMEATMAEDRKRKRQLEGKP